MDGNDDPIEDSKIGDESGQESQGEGMEACLHINGVKEGDKRKPGQKSKIKMWKRKNKENA
jgi:hypothetical protein